MSIQTAGGEVDGMSEHRPTPMPHRPSMFDAENTPPAAPGHHSVTAIDVVSPRRFYTRGSKCITHLELSL